jgi:hypothetical protein
MTSLGLKVLRCHLSQTGGAAGFLSLLKFPLSLSTDLQSIPFLFGRWKFCQHPLSGGSHGNQLSGRCFPQCVFGQFQQPLQDICALPSFLGSKVCASFLQQSRQLCIEWGARIVAETSLLISRLRATVIRPKKQPAQESTERRSRLFDFIGIIIGPIARITFRLFGVSLFRGTIGRIPLGCGDRLFVLFGSLGSLIRDLISLSLQSQAATSKSKNDTGAEPKRAENAAARDGGDAVQRARPGSPRKIRMHHSKTPTEILTPD